MQLLGRRSGCLGAVAVSVGLAGGGSGNLQLDLKAVLLFARRREHANEFDGLDYLATGIWSPKRFIAVRIAGPVMRDSLLVQVL